MIYIKVTSFFFISLTLLLTVFQYLKREEWWIRLADFIHLQLTIVSMLSWLFLLLFYLEDQISLIFICIGIPLSILHLSIILPYTKLYRKQVKDNRGSSTNNRITILEANVLMYNEDYYRLIDLVKEKQPDLLIAIETDEKWERELKKLAPEYPFQLSYAQDNTYGLHLYSKLQLVDSKIDFLVEEDVPSFSARIMLRSGDFTNLYVLHPRPPSPSENYKSLERDAELIMVGKRVSELDEPVIVAGDLNDVAWSHTSRLFKRISGLLDPRIGRGVFNTFHAGYPLVRWPLDHVFHSDHFLAGEICRLKNIGSDHFPIFIALYLKTNIAKELNEDSGEVLAEDIIEIKEKLDRLDT